MAPRIHVPKSGLSLGVALLSKRTKEAELGRVITSSVNAQGGPQQRPEWGCAVTRRRFPVGASPTRRSLQPEATGAGMEETKCLKPSDSGHELVTARVCRPQRE